MKRTLNGGDVVVGFWAAVFIMLMAWALLR
jgi:hypothetical protein